MHLKFDGCTKTLDNKSEQVNVEGEYIADRHGIRSSHVYPSLSATPLSANYSNL